MLPDRQATNQNFLLDPLKRGHTVLDSQGLLAYRHATTQPHLPAAMTAVRLGITRSSSACRRRTQQAGHTVLPSAAAAAIQPPPPVCRLQAHATPSHMPCPPHMPSSKPRTPRTRHQPGPTCFGEDVAALVINLHPLRQDRLLPADAVRDLRVWAGGRRGLQCGQREGVQVAGRHGKQQTCACRAVGSFA